ncbi:hypothetical protein [uncultured Selenomonas sp.]|uniref:hypothetical protein n=1 Tax=uncultured Selenomonas sp. TaxID=159275 RepID=UPI0025F5727F|nr:hypothetical protein [uncultured Selenomonas sp.]
MNYIVTKLVTEGETQEFSILGVTEDKQRAAEIAAATYKAYNKNASFQNVEMITEWLATRMKHSFRRDKEHRLQLAITPIDGETPEGGSALVYSASKEQDELMRKMSEALFEGSHTAQRKPNGPAVSCPMTEE